MALREDGIGQTWLVPRRVVDFIPENHICFFIANLVDGLDLRKTDENISILKVNLHIHVKC
jgi:hypothetical protein